MITNAGAWDLAKPSIGFGSGVREGDDQEAINRMFTPEFRNRLDAVISFAPLSADTIGRVVDKFVLQLEEQLADRNVMIELDDSARAWLAGKGYDRLFGARPLARVIQEHIKKPLAEELLFGQLSKGGIVRVTRKPDEDALLLLRRAAGRTDTKGARAGRVISFRAPFLPARRKGTRSPHAETGKILRAPSSFARSSGSRAPGIEQRRAGTPDRGSNERCRWAPVDSRAGSCAGPARQPRRASIRG